MQGPTVETGAPCSLDFLEQGGLGQMAVEQGPWKWRQSQHLLPTEGEGLQKAPEAAWIHTKTAGQPSHIPVLL